MAVIDEYSSANYDGTDLTMDSRDYQGQSFTGDGSNLGSAAFYLRKTGSPTGTFTYQIYAHTGTFGSTGKPTGSVLAESEAYTANDLTTSHQMIELNFTGANQITLTNGTKYCLVIKHTPGNASNYIRQGIDSSSPSHAGNFFIYTTSWIAISSYDAIFQVNGVSSAIATIGGLAKASVASIGGLAIASVESVGGLQ